MNTHSISRRRSVPSFACAVYALLVSAVQLFGSTTTPDAPSLTGDALNKFLDRASQQAQEYTAKFVDLAAHEDKVVEIFDATGRRVGRRDVASELVIYESNRSSEKREFRDVQAVDGKVLRERNERLRLLIHDLTTGDPDLAGTRVTDESSRYDFRYRVTGFTLYEALPLRASCRSGFRFTPAAATRSADEVVVNYEQVGTCREASYLLPLPNDVLSGEFRHRGRLFLETTTGRLRREERELWVHTRKGSVDLCLGRWNFEFAPSSFGLLLPKRILIEIFDHPAQAHGRTVSLGLGVRMTMNYGTFSRFTVDSAWKPSNAAQPTEQ